MNKTVHMDEIEIDMISESIRQINPKATLIEISPKNKKDIETIMEFIN